MSFVLVAECLGCVVIVTPVMLFTSSDDLGSISVLV